ncbi:hypothetical protein UR09_00685 [Candidatus Nitromaritima sp. SCGC AAA799-A02]|nr:hypothetical protein UR09_00685 [Candidatus Nitromaritima sp. SCGC AAA799-A02]
MKTILIADLTHLGQGIHAPTFPLGAGCVASYAQEALKSEFNIKLFKFPEPFFKAILEESPVVIAFSNFSWNKNLNYKICSLAKEIYPNIVTIFGGPNFPTSQKEKFQYLNSYSNIDFYIQEEGELAFVELIRELSLNNFEIGKLKNNRKILPNVNYLSDTHLIEGPVQRIKNLDVIPSPYLNGWMDPFFDEPISPIIEAARGCPFSCSFCADGIDSKNSINRFDPERTRMELEFIAKRIKHSDQLLLADLNFGMYKQDLVIADFIVDIQKKYGWPVLIKVSAGKNNPERVIETALKFRDGAWMLGTAIQSSNPEVLKNIKRSNISVDKYKVLIDTGNNLSDDSMSYSELILGLPGDSQKSYFNSIKFLLDNNVDTIRMYQAIMLAGTDMASWDTRNSFNLQTKFRVMPGGVGKYQLGNEMHPIIESEEIITSHKDLAFDDYISCRVMTLLVEAYSNNGVFKEIFDAVNYLNISTFDCLEHIFNNIDMLSPKIKTILASFIDETGNDLLESEEDALRITDNSKLFSEYLSGNTGINELLHFRWELLLCFREMTEGLLKAIKDLMVSRNTYDPSTWSYLKELSKFITLRKEGIFENFSQPLEETFDYDFIEIHNLKFNIDSLVLDRCKKKSRLTFYHTPEQIQHLAKTKSLHLNSPLGMGRAIQQSNLKMFYRKFQYART